MIDGGDPEKNCEIICMILVRDDSKKLIPKYRKKFKT